jgi:hypothetical protein
MTDETAIVAKPIDAAGELYQRRALLALPVLVRQAWAGRSIYYGEIARELGMPNPRNMNYVLGSVGTSLQILSAKWNERIPPLQVLAINVSAGLPGEGFAEFTSDPDAFKRAPLYQRRRTIDALTAQVRAYPRWRDVLTQFGAKPPAASQLDVLLPVSERVQLGGQGESEAHREFKLFVAKHPELVKVAGLTLPASIEYCFPSSDTVDVLFTTPTALVAVEVKSRLSSDADVLRGIFQCVKYRALLDAVVVVEQREVATRAVLALQGELPASLLVIATTLGVEVFNRLGAPSALGDRKPPMLNSGR